jgi:hypothetical protein
MIIVTYPDKPLLTTDKRTLKRQPNLSAYEADIKVAYAALADSARQDIAFPVSWDVDSIINFVRELTAKVMRKSIGDEDDIFQNGGDRYMKSSNTINACFLTSRCMLSQPASNIDP